MPRKLKNCISLAYLLTSRSEKNLGLQVHSSGAYVMDWMIIEGGILDTTLARMISLWLSQEGCYPFLYSETVSNRDKSDGITSGSYNLANTSVK